MNKKFLIYIIFGIISYFYICFNVFAKDSLVGISRAYGLALDEVPLTEKNYGSFKKSFNDFIKEKGNSEYTYLLIRYNMGGYYLFGGDFQFEEMFLNTSYKIKEEVKDKYYFTIQFNENDVKINNSWQSENKFNEVLDFSMSNYITSATYLVWSNKPLITQLVKEESRIYYYYDLITDDALKKYYTFDKLEVNKPIYTFTNLLFGDYEGKEPEKVSYKVEYYFDDILSPEKTEFKSGYENDLVTDFTDYSSDLYKLYIENQDYKLTLTKNESANVLKVYYRSPLYGTLKQPIDTSNSKIYLFFQFSDIKAMFPNVRFENFTQFEQLVVVVLFNILYCIFIFVCLYIVLKACFKCWSWVMEFVR